MCIWTILSRLLGHGWSGGSGALASCRNNDMGVVPVNVNFIIAFWRAAVLVAVLKYIHTVASLFYGLDACYCMYVNIANVKCESVCQF